MLLKKLYSQKNHTVIRAKNGKKLWKYVQIIKHICSVYGYKNASVNGFEAYKDSVI
jgi:hypothetical protein